MTDRYPDRQTIRQLLGQRDRNMDKQTSQQIDICQRTAQRTLGHPYRQLDRQTIIEALRQLERQSHGQTDRQLYKQTERHLNN